ncbi:hypothetical protein T265_11988 [Opisthorchis viverrini]|uniref:Peptidase S1 domain-containing protein n=1 Tax=Opisthorchis viverrini TaxID=6198 RepID=A0A074ZVD7_OPIVI|nr:hypothetical protein T265_11988 [Opisthorchis viverrini]KER19134.1 hypothetical protein T265_11988 [Opisthorchis viverrini]
MRRTATRYYAPQPCDFWFWNRSLTQFQPVQHAFYVLEIHASTSVHFVEIRYHYISNEKRKNDIHLKPHICFIRVDYTRSTLVLHSTEAERNGLTFVDVALVDKRIIGGTNVVQGTYKWAVKFTVLWSDQNSSTCSGNILSNKWILTAAHCCVDAQLKIVRSVIEAGNPNVALVCVVGTGQSNIALSLFILHSNAVPPNIQVAHSPTCYPHENYTKNKGEFRSEANWPRETFCNDAYDIALLKLSTPLDLTRPNISIVNLPTTQNSTLPQVNDAGVIVGFGIFLHPDIDPTTGQLATFKVVTQQKCSQLHGAYNPTYNFCIDDELTRRAMPVSRL